MNNNEALQSIRNLVKAWKTIFTKDLPENSVTKDSPWSEILRRPEFRESSYFSEKLNQATRKAGKFADEHYKYLISLPGFSDIIYENRLPLDIMTSVKNFVCVIPIMEYTIVTDRKELHGLDIYIFKATLFPKHTIIRYVPKAPEFKKMPEIEGQILCGIMCTYVPGPVPPDDTPF